ncbi:MAG TPA: HprK-related kinase B [Enhygromyxa sp.]|nr:HprK-related kinase B [Enhygromyxa sp.]
MADARPVESVAATIAALRGEHPSTDGCGWDFDGFRVWVDSNAPRLLAQLQRYFADFRRLDASSLAEARGGGLLTHISAIECDPPDLGARRALEVGEHKPSVRGPKEAYFDTADGRVIHKLRTGMWFLFGRDSSESDCHLAIGPCTENPNQVINFVNNRMIQWALHRGALLGHASAVCHVQPGAPLPRAIAIAGFSGMGKSTLALHLMNDRRIDFLSNDRVMIHARRGDAPAELEGVPKHPRINPGTILHNPDLAGVLSDDERTRFERLEPAELWPLEHKYDGLIRECFPTQRFFLRAELVGLVLLDWHHGAGPATAARIDLGQRRELLPALIKEPGLFYRPGPGEVASRDPDRYLEFLAGLPILELAGGVDFDYGRAAALELLGV